MNLQNVERVKSGAFRGRWVRFQYSVSAHSTACTCESNGGGVGRVRCAGSDLGFGSSAYISPWITCSSGTERSETLFGRCEGQNSTVPSTCAKFSQVLFPLLPKAPDNMDQGLNSRNDISGRNIFLWTVADTIEAADK